MEDSSSSSSSSSRSSGSIGLESECNIPNCCPPKAKPKKEACSSKKEKCARPGKVTRNPFLNFLRDFRLQNCGKSMVKIAVEAGCVWKKMSDCEKEKYRKMACSAPKQRKKSKKKKYRRSY